jgi:preprotein translocase subunit YajC
MLDMNTWLVGTTLTIGAQEGGSLPNTVPGLDGGGSGGEAGTVAPGGQQGGGAPAANPFGNTLFMMLALLLVFMIVSTMMTGRREKKRMAQMLAELKRGDRVLTVSGMYGTVHEVKPDAIVLRIDEVSGAKAQFSKSAVSQVVRSARGEGKASAESEETVAGAG